MPLSESDDEHAAPSDESGSSDDDPDMPPFESALSTGSLARLRGKPSPTCHSDPRQRRTAARADSDSLLRKVAVSAVTKSGGVRDAGAAPARGVATGGT